MEGAESMISRIANGTFVRPQGLTDKALRQYRNVAVEMIARGKDGLGTQAKRIEAIDSLLKR